MAFTLRLDISTATVADLEAFVAAARAGGIDKRSALCLDGEELVLTAAGGQTQAVAEPERPASPVGDAAIRTVIDILSGRQNSQER